MDRRETEILVHIAAPSRAADDTNYRALAAAYLNFEPTTRKCIGFDAPEEGGGEVAHGLENGEEEVAHNSEAVERRPAEERRSQSCQRPAVIRSPMMSFQSAIHNFGSPRLHKPEEGSPQEPQSLWEPPASVVQDSMPDNTDFVLPEYCTPTRILQYYTSTFSSTQPNTSPVSQRRLNQTLLTSSPLQSTSFRPLPDADGSSQPQLPPVDPATVTSGPPGRGEKRSRAITPTSFTSVEDTRIASSDPTQQAEPASPSRADSEPPLAKRPRTLRDPEPGKPLARSVSDVGPQRALSSSPRPPLLDTLVIESPSPLTTHQTLSQADTITDVLASLARELDLAKRFQPTLQARALLPFERGYWLVNCAGWDDDLKCSAWAFLDAYVRKGAAGWGTTCRRDRDFSWIRVYCWGGVVGHLYLVLYLMSKRRVLYTGTKWIAADGGAVVVMGARAGTAVG